MKQDASAPRGNDKDAGMADAVPTILVTEDDRNMRELILAVLAESSMTFKVASAENAHEAMDFL
jgi:CheY-like chemotaxis protein